MDDYQNPNKPQRSTSSAQIEINFQVANGDRGFMYLNLTGMSTIDAGDVAYAVKNMEKELSRLQSSRTFNQKG